MQDMRAIQIKETSIPKIVGNLFQKQVDGMWKGFQWRQFHDKVVIGVLGKIGIGEGKGKFDLMRARAESNRDR